MTKKMLTAMCLLFSTGFLFAQDHQPSQQPPAPPPAVEKEKAPQPPEKLVPRLPDVLPLPDFKFELPELPQPSAEELNQEFLEIWLHLGVHYYKDSKLSKWSDHLDKHRGKLKKLPDLYAAVDEMVASLDDRWTRYIRAEDLIKQLDRAHSNLVDLGLAVLAGKDGLHRVDDLVYGSDAYKSDLRRGDVVVSVGGTKLKGLSNDKVDELFYGAVGTAVEVVFSHDGKEEKANLTFKKPVKPVVEGRLLDGGVAYLRLPNVASFALSFGLLRELEAVKKQTKDGVKGIVLDLRGNPGGDFTVSYQLASLFLEKGVLVNSFKREGVINSNETKQVVPMPYKLTGMLSGGQELLELLRSAPLVVLIDECSASGAEVVAGAIKDNKRAVLVGETTWGKGVGYSQRAFSFGMLQWTNLEYSSPNGFKPDGKGIAPDKTVVRQRGSTTDEQLKVACAVLKEEIQKRTK
jgi:carboxyl-terminal processing protease